MLSARVPSTAGWHHAMNRAPVDKAWLSRPVAEAFLSCLSKACRAFAVEIHAYCVLPRHYHVLARAETGALRTVLGEVERSAGSVFSAPLRIIPVAFGRHLTAVSRYIHLNPVDAGFVEYPEHWRLSSFLAYLGDRNAPRWISTEAVLGRFGNIGARHRHRAYVHAGMDPGSRDRDGRPRPAISGDHSWRIEPVLVPRPCRAEASPGRASLAHLAREVADAFEVEAAALRGARGGGPAAARARGALVHTARAQGGHRLRDVAAFIGYASPAAAAAAAARFSRTTVAS